MPVTEALDRVLEILRTTELYSPQFGAKDDDPHANDLVGGLVSVSVLTGRWLHPAALIRFLRGHLLTSCPTQCSVCGVSHGIDHALPRLSCPPAEPSPTCCLSRGVVGTGDLSLEQKEESVQDSQLVCCVGSPFLLKGYTSSWFK